MHVKLFFFLQHKLTCFINVSVREKRVKLSFIYVKQVILSKIVSFTVLRTTALPADVLVDLFAGSPPPQRGRLRLEGGVGGATGDRVQL